MSFVNLVNSDRLVSSFVSSCVYFVNYVVYLLVCYFLHVCRLFISFMFLVRLFFVQFVHLSHRFVLFVYFVCLLRLFIPCIYVYHLLHFPFHSFVHVVLRLSVFAVMYFICSVYLLCLSISLILRLCTSLIYFVYLFRVSLSFIYVVYLLLLMNSFI